MESVRKFILWFRFHELVLISCLIVAVESSNVVVDSPFGKIQGAKKTDDNTGQSYLSFKGIPYAKPPVGDLRFAKPQPHPNIDGIFDASKDNKIICPHFDSMTNGEMEFTEHCLVLNVYTSEIDQINPLKKVLVFIHGGGFTAGFSTIHNPKSLVISQDIIVVTINYRIGILGFLSTENEVSPGNYGLWDQTLAIKWVKDNIRAFGGDPDDIAIAGESAGAASVGFQALSPYAKGLFTKAYAQSGFATSNFALYFNALKDALSVAKSTGCWEASVDEAIGVQESRLVINCLRNVSLSAITAFDDISLTDVQFAPRVDGDFISDTPFKLLENDKYLDSVGFFDLTYLTAVNNNEAQLSDRYYDFMKFIVSMYPEDARETIMANYVTKIKDVQIRTRFGESAASNKSISHEIKNFYKRRFINEQAMIEMTTDTNFILPSFDLVRAASRRENCRSYLLYFNYFPTFLKGSYTGVPHAGDLLFLFDIDISSMETAIGAGMQGQMDAEDLEVKRMFISLIGEFVRSGNPGLTPNKIIPCGWPKYDVINSHYLNFDSKPWIGSFLEKDKQDLWFRTVPRLMGKTDVVDDNKGCPVDGSPILASCCQVVAFSVLFVILLTYF